MSLSGSLLDNKDASPQGFQPLLLATFTFQDGSTLRASTHNLSGSEGGNSYAGNDYLARIEQQDIQAIQARSEQGIDRISEVTIHLYNADQYLLTNYEQASGKGFKGAAVKLALVLMDIDPATGNYIFTDDSPAPVKFAGVCDSANCENGGQMLSVRATTSHNLARVDFPILHCQQRCINVMPQTAAQRLAGATDMSSWWWGCGYNPDQTGTDPEIGGDCRRGNTTSAWATDAQGRKIADGAGIYTSCNYTKTDCVARGMYAKDSANRWTGRFTAIQWAPTQREGQSKSYKQGKDVTVFSSRNDSIYDRSYPMVYGSQWIKRPLIANILGDGNSTRFEVVVCMGDIGPAGIQQVVVNGVIVPANGAGADALFRWNFLDQSSFASTHTGSRNGYSNPDALYDGNGDPYGGLATIENVVFSDLAQSNSTPDVRVMTGGPRIIKYAPIASYAGGVLTLPAGIVNADIAGNPPFTIQVLGNSLTGLNGVWGLTSWSYGPPGTVTLSSGPAGAGTGGYIRYLARSNNPAWVIFDLLIWGNYSFPDLDIPSFVAAAAYCDTPMDYLDQMGNTASHARFLCEMALEDRRKGNEVIQAVLRSFNAQLVPNTDTGLLQLLIRRTLADQQPAAIPGSNDDTPVSSIHADGSAGSGYVAYRIDESVVQQDGKGIPRLRGPYSLPSSQAPNRVSFPFQNSENSYSDDSISVTDPEDVARAAGYQAGGQQIDAGITVLGISNFDQGIRCANVILAESLRGNENGDTRGTRFYEVETTCRLEHLRVGQIVRFAWQAHELDQLFRVDQIKPTSNYERMTITLRWHEDLWYTDSYGQYAAPPYSDPGKSLPARPPYPWTPYGEQPITGNSMWDRTEWNFGVAQVYGLDANGQPLAQLSILGCPPVNQFSAAVQLPLLGRQGGTANTGGTIQGGQRIHMALSVQDSSGKWSPLSRVGYVDIPSATNTNTAVTAAIQWQAGTSAWVLFAGVDEQQWCAQKAVGQSSEVGTGTPSTITITSLAIATFGPPDALSDALLFEIAPIHHGGVWGDTCSGVHSNGDGTGTITFGTACTTHQFQQTSSTVGYDLSLLALPFGTPDAIPLADFHVIDNAGGVYTVKPDPVGITAGCVFEMRAFPSVVTDTTIGDPNFVNAYGPNGLGTAGDEELGYAVLIVKGKGRGQERSITANNGTTLTIDHAWDTLPDNTSRFIIISRNFQSQPSARQSAAELVPSPVPVVAVPSVLNYGRQSVFVRAYVIDQRGNRCLKRWSPSREIFLFGAQGTRTIYADAAMLPEDGLVLCDTSGITGYTTTLTADATDSDGTVSIAVKDHVINTEFLQIGSEVMQVLDGAGTLDLTVSRGAQGTTAAVHASGATVEIPGVLTFSYLPGSQVPNQTLLVRKVSSDRNIVDVTTGTEPDASRDTFPGGGTDVYLIDTSASNGTCFTKFPG